MVTRKDVALLAGVSSTSVSYYINKNGYVSKEHGERIQQAIDTLGYCPNLVAKSLKTKNSRQLVFLCNQVKNPFHADLISKLTELAYHAGYMMLFSNILTEKDYIDRICSYQVDGVFIISDNVLPKYINKICSQGINVVLINNMTWTDIDKRISRIIVDLAPCIKELVRMVLDKGHTKCLCVSPLQYPEHIPYDKKLVAFTEALREHKILVTAENFLLHINSEADVYNRLPAILQLKIPPTAYICCNDNLALSVLGLLNQKNIRVPQDIAVTGFDNISSSQFSFPKLTTAEINASEMAQQAMRMMLEKIEGKQIPDYVITTQLKIRESI